MSVPEMGMPHTFAANGVRFRQYGDEILILGTALGSGDVVLASMDRSTFAGVIAQLSPHREANGSHAYVMDFLAHGTMHCGGCGTKLTPDKPGVGTLSVVNRACCAQCYEDKFKPLFDWGKAGMQGAAK